MARAESLELEASKVRFGRSQPQQKQRERDERDERGRNGLGLLNVGLCEN